MTQKKTQLVTAHSIDTVSVYNTQRRFPIDAKAVEAIAREVVALEGRFCHEVALHFVGVQRICSLHAQFFDDPSVTDCISFPIDSEEEGPYKFLGEVFVCPDTAWKYVKAHGGLLYEEITLYIVHGLLHLLGYDDIEEADVLQMREREHFHMENLKKQKLELRQRE
ncbi:MAG: rRNA maturation RNase YbeY [Parachlamydiaceae bacterium]|nr:rRNA maturation RNase YbeY [Parachlamydiaceae bacterium]